jgi:ABC-type lipoprotein release transport system permease subunit
MHLLASVLFGVSRRDPVTLASVACIVLAVSAVAAGVPAHRAAKVDPLTALRSE